MERVGKEGVITVAVRAPDLSEHFSPLCMNWLLCYATVGFQCRVQTQTLSALTLLSALQLLTSSVSVLSIVSLCGGARSSCTL